MESKIQSHVEINLRSIQANAESIRHLTNTSLIAVVKANAYGHGAVAVADVLHSIVDMFAVATVEEGIELRLSGIRNPILILLNPLQDCVDEIVSYELTPSIDNLNFATRLNEAVELRNSLIQLAPIKKIKVHLDINTGMNRSGIHYDTVKDFLNKIKTLNRLEIDGVFTHFATADEDDISFAYIQLQRFTTVVEEIEKSNNGLPIFHCANSAGTLSIPESYFDAVRPGLALYGIYPSKIQSTELQPTLTWKTHVGWIDNVDPGEGVSYGLTYKTKQQSSIAGLQVGFGDGYPRSLSNIGEVLIGGVRRPILGNICMDTMVVGLGNSENISVGDEVVLIGKQGDEEIRIEEIAEKANTITYEILTRIGKRVNRIYK